jgi:hypothetical protein
MRKKWKSKNNLVSPNSCIVDSFHWWLSEVAKVASSEYEIPILLTLFVYILKNLTAYQTSEIFKNKKS